MIWKNKNIFFLLQALFLTCLPGKDTDGLKDVLKVLEFISHYQLAKLKHIAKTKKFDIGMYDICFFR